MSDVFTKAKRSEVRSRIRSRGNQDTELALVKLFRAYRITGWRRNQPVFGKPDFVFPRLKLAVFVDGCFWHGCPKHATQPASNRAFWKKKLTRNQARDQLVNRTLRQQGWTGLRIWQPELAAKREAHLLRRIRRVLVWFPQHFDSLAPARPARRAFGFIRFLPPFPKRFKSARGIIDPSWS